ncbi:MAG: NAD(P)/FAD-dependent oxidoreductase [Acidiferrobacterales bacterium]|nr:NAD(P)/FAD-dependent oxidoreductase [Acidiferrobacterales bacterium]
MTERVAIIGAGPAGCALACMLVERGIDCLVYDDDKKPSLLVGESLVPAAMPIIRRLGIEDEVAQFSQRKAGAALRKDDVRVNFTFRQIGKDVPAYAYNIPRPKFDQIVRRRAESLGVKFVSQRAKVEPCDNETRELQLSDESLRAAHLTRDTQPDLLIDSTGRTRLFSKTLGLKAQRGPRNDVAHFAHIDNFSSDSELEGQIVISVLKCGWSWQIPLADKTSVGVVMNAEAIKKYGATAEQRLENVIRDNAVLNKQGWQRLSEVKTYSNYQLFSEKAHGKGWILLGDALGFVDPMLSPGVFMALESASLLDKHVFSQHEHNELQREQALDQYYRDIQEWHKAWSHLIEYFYDGRLLSLGERRPNFTDDSPRYSFPRFADSLVGKMLAQLVSGAGTRSGFYQGALYRTCQLLCRDKQTNLDYSIKSSIDDKCEVTPLPSQSAQDIMRSREKMSA